MFLHILYYNILQNIAQTANDADGHVIKNKRKNTTDKMRSKIWNKQILVSIFYSDVAGIYRPNCQYCKPI